jgi:antitoxin component YwqK of YwqJK toxin-antitoxin module
MIRIFLKESRAEQLRRELDNAVNGTDYGYSSIKPGDDEAANRFKNLEIDDETEQSGQVAAGQSSEDVRVNKDFYSNGRIRRIEYRNSNVQVHRTDGPAITYWYENGQKCSECFYVNGQVHRTDGPALTRWYENGQKALEEFWVRDRCHRTDGPAISNWADDGEKSTELFVVDGRQLSEEEWWSKYGQYLNRDYLDLDGESEGMKPFDDKELEARGRGLEIEPPKAPNAYKFTKNRKPETDPRFKALELDEKLNRIRKEFKRPL